MWDHWCWPAISGPSVNGAARGGSTIGPIPSFVSDAAVTDWLKPVADKPGNFHAAGRDNDDQTREIDLVPFYRLHRRTYAIYWDLYTPGTWKQKLAEVAAERERQRKLEAATISSLQPGDTNKERSSINKVKRRRSIA
jgi:hypothetical protein